VEGKEWFAIEGFRILRCKPRLEIRFFRRPINQCAGESVSSHVGNTFVKEFGSEKGGRLRSVERDNGALEGGELSSKQLRAVLSPGRSSKYSSWEGSLAKARILANSESLSFLK